MTGKLLAQRTAASAPQSGLAEGYDPRRDPEEDLAAARAEAKKRWFAGWVNCAGALTFPCSIVNSLLSPRKSAEYPLWSRWNFGLDRFFDEHPNLEALRDKNYVPMKVSMSQENPNCAFPLPPHSWVSAYLHFGRRGEIDSLSTNVLEDGRSYNAKRLQRLLEQCAPKRRA
jgi:hypothetical protein